MSGRKVPESPDIARPVVPRHQTARDAVRLRRRQGDPMAVPCVNGGSRPVATWGGRGRRLGFGILVARQVHMVRANRPLGRPNR
jgi:hypothetical protein